MCGPAFSESFEQLFENALMHDLQLNIHSISLESRELSVERSNLKSPFKLSVGTGNSGLQIVQTFDDSPSTSITLDPRVSVTLPEGVETEISLSADIDLGLPDEVDPAFKPVLSVSQPLNPLFGLEASKEGKMLDERSSHYQSQVAIWSREIAVRKDVVGKVRAIVVGERNLIESEQGITSAEDALTKARVLETYNEESVDFLALLQALETAQRGFELTHRQLDFSRNELAMLVGMDVADIPREVPPFSLEVPAPIDTDLSPSIQSSRMNLEKAEIALEDYRRTFIPQYGVNASYALDPQTIVAGFSADFENLSITTGVAADIDDEYGSLSLQINWLLPDNRGKKLKTRELEIAVEVARLQHEDALRKAARGAELLRLEAANIENRMISLQGKIHLAELTLNEKRRRHDLGALSDAGLHAQERILEKLHTDRVLLEFDMYSLSLDISSLTF
jgi:hypothetical protein